MLKKILKLIIIATALVLASLGLFNRGEKIEKFPPREYDEIMSEGVIRAVTEYNSISYYVKGDTIEGFDYELLNAFARNKGIRVEITPEMSFEKRQAGVINGWYDILAKGTLVTSASKDSLLFTKPLQLGKQVLIQRKEQEENDSNFISSPLELRGKTLHVVKNSPALLRIHNLMNEMADTIYLAEEEEYGTEQLVAMVAAGDIDYAVCDDETARKAMTEYNNIDIATDISFTQFYAWGVNKHSPVLLDSLNSWLNQYIRTKEYKQLYKKYFR